MPLDCGSSDYRHEKACSLFPTVSKFYTGFGMLTVLSKPKTVFLGYGSVLCIRNASARIKT